MKFFQQRGTEFWLNMQNTHPSIFLIFEKAMSFLEDGWKFISYHFGFRWPRRGFNNLNFSWLPFLWNFSDLFIWKSWKFFNSKAQFWKTTFQRNKWTSTKTWQTYSFLQFIHDWRKFFKSAFSDNDDEDIRNLINYSGQLLQSDFKKWIVFKFWLTLSKLRFLFSKNIHFFRKLWIV